MEIKKENSGLGLPVFLSPENFQDQDLWLRLVKTYYSEGVRGAQFLKLKNLVENIMVERFDKAKRQNEEFSTLANSEYLKSRNDLVEWLINYPWSIGRRVILKQVTINNLWHHNVSFEEIKELQEECLSAITVPPAEINYAVDRGKEVRKPSSRSVYHLLDLYEPTRGKFDTYFMYHFNKTVRLQIAYHFYGHIPGSEKYSNAMGKFYRNNKRYPKNDLELALYVGVSLKTIEKWRRMQEAAILESIDDKDEIITDPQAETDEEQREKINTIHLMNRLLQEPPFKEIDRIVFMAVYKTCNDNKKILKILQENGYIDVTDTNLRTIKSRLFKVLRGHDLFK